MHRSGLLSALQEWERVADAASPDEDFTVFDQAALQIFWQRRPHVSSWAGAVWRSERRSRRRREAARRVRTPRRRRRGRLTTDAAATTIGTTMTRDVFVTAPDASVSDVAGRRGGRSAG